MTAPYPPPPWRLVGEALLLYQFVPVAAVRAQVPPALRILQVWPGHTLSMLYLASYRSPSTLAYHELLHVPALVRHGCRAGAWIAQACVDDAGSCAGGQAIWNLPKQLADFEGSFAEGAMRVKVDGREVAALRWTPAGTGLRLPLRMPALVLTTGDPARFTGRGSARVGHCAAQLDGLQALQPMHGVSAARALHLRDMDLLVPAPR